LIQIKDASSVRKQSQIFGGVIAAVRNQLSVSDQLFLSQPGIEATAPPP